MKNREASGLSFGVVFPLAFLFCIGEWFWLSAFLREKMVGLLPPDTPYEFSVKLFFSAPAFMLAVGVVALPLLVSLVIGYINRSKPKLPWFLFAGCTLGAAALVYVLQWPMELACYSVEYMIWKESIGLYTGYNQSAYLWYAAAVVLTLAAANLCLLLKVPAWARLAAMGVYVVLAVAFTWVGVQVLYYVPMLITGRPSFPFAASLFGAVPGFIGATALLLIAGRKKKDNAEASAEGE